MEEVREKETRAVKNSWQNTKLGGREMKNKIPP